MWMRNPINDVFTMNEIINTVFDQFSEFNEQGRNPHKYVGTWKKGHNALPKETYRRAVSDVTETETGFLAHVELPGVNKKDIQLNVEDDKLEIKVEKKAEIKNEDKDSGEKIYKKSYAGFYRSFSLPENVNVDAIDATYENGVLRLNIPKKEIEQKKVKQITIK